MLSMLLGVIVLVLGCIAYRKCPIKRWQAYCIYCDSYRNEWFGLKRFIENRGRCFYCRMDYLDDKYGPSESAKIIKKQYGQYNRSRLNNREKRRLRAKLSHQETPQ